MKILGQTKEGFIVSVGRTELANLAGFYSEYSDEAKVMAMGVDVPVGDIYKNALETLTFFEKLGKNFEESHASIGKLLTLIGPKKKR